MRTLNLRCDRSTGVTEQLGWPVWASGALGAMRRPVRSFGRISVSVVGGDQEGEGAEVVVDQHEFVELVVNGAVVMVCVFGEGSE